MILVDGSPLVWGPVSVAHIVRGWLLGWPEDRAVRLALPHGATPPEGLSPEVVLHDARPAATPRAFRARFAALAGDVGATGFLSPWAAFPRDLPRRVDVVALVHELPFVRHGALEGRMRGWRHRRWLHLGERRGVRWAVPSHATREDLLSFLAQAEGRVEVVPPGFDPRPWEAARRGPDTPPYAVMVGLGHGRRGARKKGLDVLLEAWRRGAPAGWRLVLAGTVPGPLPAGVEACGALHGDALRARVAGASLLVYPSRSEGFGFPPLEAMAADVPVLATDAGATPATVGDAAWLVAAGDAEALAAGLGRLAGDGVLRARLRARGRIRAAQFPCDASARAVLALFDGAGVPA